MLLKLRKKLLLLKMLLRRPKMIANMLCNKFLKLKKLSIKLRKKKRVNNRKRLNFKKQLKSLWIKLPKKLRKKKLKKMKNINFIKRQRLLIRAHLKMMMRQMLKLKLMLIKKLKKLRMNLKIKKPMRVIRRRMKKKVAKMKLKNKSHHPPSESFCQIHSIIHTISINDFCKMKLLTYIII